MKFVPRLRIAQKLPLVVVGVALLALASVGIGAYLVAAQTVVGMTKDKLQTLAQLRASELQGLYQGVSQDLVATAASATTISAINELGIGWGSLNGNETAQLQKAFITDNPNPVGKKQLLDTVEGMFIYGNGHAKYNPNFRNQQASRGYGDIFLFDGKGNNLYSVDKNPDYAENFASGGSFGDSPLGQVYQSAAKLTRPGTFVFADVAPCCRANGAPPSFIAAPVFGPHGAKTADRRHRLRDAAAGDQQADELDGRPRQQRRDVLRRRRPHAAQRLVLQQGQRRAADEL